MLLVLLSCLDRVWPVCPVCLCWSLLCICLSGNAVSPRAAALQLLAEYLLSRQLDEAAACVKELDCSLFHHEIVKRAVKVGLR